MPLSAKHERFCREYAVDGNGSRAARAAGYSQVSAGELAARLLKKVSIRKRVDELTAKHLQKADVNAEMVINGLRSLATFDFRRLYHEDGRLKEPQELDDETAQAIAGFKVKELFEDGDGKGCIGQIKEYKLADRQKALEALGRTMAMFTDKLQHTGLEGIPELLDEVRARKTRRADAPSGDSRA